MKKIYFSLISFLYVTTLLSQNWQPIVEGDKYNFVQGNSKAITVTIWVDSTHLQNDTSVFFLNRIITDCDTCVFFNKDLHALDNQPQFLLRKMITHPDGKCIFYDPDSMILLTQAKDGDTWVFDPKNDIHAVVSQETEIEIFEQLDSIKIIALSNDKEIILSKNYGILEFPVLNKNTDDYKLVGIEGDREMGKQVPDFWDFYDLNVGESYYVNIDEGGFDDGQGTWDDFPKYQQYRIVDKQTTNSNISYDIKGWDLDIWGANCGDNGIIIHSEDDYVYCIIPTPFTKTIVYNCNKKDPVNGYNNQKVSYNWEHEKDIQEEDRLPIFSKVIIESDSVKKFGGYEGYCNQYSMTNIKDLLFRRCDFACYTELYDYDSIKHWYFDPDEYDISISNSFIFKVGLGHLKYIEEYSTCFEAGHYYKYTHLGYTLNRKQNGFLYSEDLLDHIEEQPKSIDISLFPNPAKNELNVQLNNNLSNTELKLYSATGILLFEKNLKSLDTRIDISNYKSGLYIVKISTGNYSYVSKVQKE